MGTELVASAMETLFTMANARDLATTASGPCTPYNFSANPLTPGAMWDWRGWYVIVDLFILFTVLFLDLVPIEFAMVAAVLMLAAAQIITVADMTQGFANAGILAVACLFIVAEGLSSTGAIDYFMGKLLGSPKTLGQALTRMMIPAAFVAAWISSTAVLAVLIPVIQRWSKRINQPPSLLFMPLCYAIHLGGTVTLIGTTTNLVISGLAQQYYCRTMGIFELTTVGLPVCIAGIGALLLISPKVLPDAKTFEKRTSYGLEPTRKHHKPTLWRKIYNKCCCCFSRKTILDPALSEEELVLVEGDATMPKVASDFVFHAVVPENSPMHEKSVEEVGLRSLDGLFLASVRRANTIYSAVGPEFHVRAGDDLGFAGMANNFIPMCKEKGLMPVVEGEAINNEDNVGENPLANFTIEAVIRADSDLIRKSMKEVNFRTRYNASTLAIYRAGSTIQSAKLGTVQLKVGDVMVLVVSDRFSWDAPETKRDLKPRYDVARQRGTDLGVLDTDLTNKRRDYVFSMRVSSSMQLQLVQPLSGLTLEEAGLRNLAGCRVVAVTHEGHTDRCVGPDFVLAAEDVIWFAGDRDALSSLRRIPGLEDSDSDQVKKLRKAPQTRRLVEVVVSLQSDLLFKTVKESRFRTRFNAAIVAVQRHGHRVLAKIGDIELEPGDVLILDAGPDFVKRFRSDPNFLVISELESSAPPRMDRFYIAATASLAMVICTAATGMDILLFALFACGIMLATGVLTRERAHKAIDWKIIITVASAFGLSTAMTNTKVADVIGRALTSFAVSTGTGELMILGVVMVFTEILCALITAKAGALLMFPIAASAAAKLNIDPTRMIIALMLGSSDYTTPQGHQTNLMVYGPGGYVFTDYQKLGIPLEIFLNIVQLVCLAFYKTWWWTTLGAVFLLSICIWIDQSCVAKRPVRELIPTCSCRRRKRRGSSSGTPGAEHSNDGKEKASDEASNECGDPEAQSVSVTSSQHRSGVTVSSAPERTIVQV